MFLNLSQTTDQDTFFPATNSEAPFGYALPKTEAECPPGTNIYDDSCVLEGSGFEPLYNCPPEYPSYSDAFNSCIRLTDMGIKVGPKPTSAGISPALILAAAAAAFFIGG